MLQFASNLSDDYEYAILCWGQSNGLPQGTLIDSPLGDPGAIDESPHMALPVSGVDLRIASISGNVITLTSSVLAINSWGGCEIRLIYSTMGYATTSNRIGYGIVASNSANTITVTSWLVSPGTHGVELPDITTPDVSFSSSSGLLATTVDTHGLATGDIVVFAAVGVATAPTGITFGLNYVVQAVPSSTTFRVTSVLDGAAIAYTNAGSGSMTFTVSFGGYMHFVDDRRTYPTVRVLKTYMPESVGGYPAGAPAVAGMSYPASITGYETAGAFVDFTYREGIEGIGGVGTSTTIASLVVTDAGAAWLPDLYIGGYARVGNAWGVITDNDATSFTVASWNGTQPTNPAPYEFHIRHWRDNPNHTVPGFGFRTPSNVPFPTVFTDVYNRPRGRLIGSNVVPFAGVPYYTFGTFTEIAWRLSHLLGRRIHVVHMASGAAGFLRTTSTGRLGYQGSQTIGWYGPSQFNDWVPEQDDNLAYRWERMATLIAPAALTAEGNTKPLRYIAVCGFHGETDASSTVGVENYERLLSTFLSWVRRFVFDAGMSPFAHINQLPLAMAEIAQDPWVTGVSAVDTEDEVNAAIRGIVKMGFAKSFTIAEDDKLLNSQSHFNGVGEAKNAKSAVEALLPLIDSAFSAREDLSDAEAVNICNMALSYIGDVAKITSLDTAVDLSAQAAYCARFYNTARETLLQQMAWSFATRRVPLVAITGARSDEWAYAYAYPDNAVRVFAVLPPEAGDDYLSGISGTGVVQDLTGAITTRASSAEVPLPFTVEQDSDGYRIIYTNSENAIARFNVRGTDPRQYSPLFKNCLALKLASMLAGPIIRGMEGVKLSGGLLQMLELEMGKAEKQDAIQHNVKLKHTPSSIRARR